MLKASRKTLCKCYVRSTYVMNYEYRRGVGQSLSSEAADRQPHSSTRPGVGFAHVRQSFLFLLLLLLVDEELIINIPGRVTYLCTIANPNEPSRFSSRMV